MNVMKIAEEPLQTPCLPSFNISQRINNKHQIWNEIKTQ